MKKLRYKAQRVKYKNKKKSFILWGVATAFILTAVLVTLSLFQINQVIVEGNEHYTDDEIKEMVLGKSVYNTNSLYVSWNNREYKKDIPFISSMDVEMVDKHTIKITVYEKSIVGYIEYLGANLYFDKDGIMVESSSTPIEDVPLIMGLNVPHVTLHQKLPVEDEQIFNTILSLTNFLRREEMIPDKIFFSEEGEMTLYFDQARVLLGKDEYMEEKLSDLKGILPKMEGMSGKLHMETYDPYSMNYTFEND